MIPVLYPDQADLVERTRAAAMICRRPILLSAATGAGKSIMALFLTLLAYQKGKRILFIVSGRHLVTQFAEHLRKAGIPYTVLMAGHRLHLENRVIVASKDTFDSRVMSLQTIDLPEAELVIVDECDLCTTEAWIRILQAYEKKSAVIVGLTGTPVGPKGKGLGGIFGAKVEGLSTSKLIAAGRIVPARVFAPYLPDVKDCPVGDKGEFDASELGKRMNRPTITGNAVQHWIDHAEGRRTIVTCCTREHAKDVSRAFNEAGILSKYVDGNTDDGERDGVYDELESGKIKCIIQVAVLARGVDIPAAEVAVILRPCRSFKLYLQIIGRVRRVSLATGKTHCLILDHAGATYTHGWPDDDVEWHLDEDVSIDDVRDREKAEGKIESPKICPECHCLFVRRNVCPNCGREVKTSNAVKEHSGKLVEIGADENKVVDTVEQQIRFWHGCLARCANSGRTVVVAKIMFKNKYDKWPPSNFPNNPPFEHNKTPVVDLYPGYKRMKVAK